MNVNDDKEYEGLKRVSGFATSFVQPLSCLFHPSVLYKIVLYFIRNVRNKRQRNHTQKNRYTLFSYPIHIQIKLQRGYTEFEVKADTNYFLSHLFVYRFFMKSASQSGDFVFPDPRC